MISKTLYVILIFAFFALPAYAQPKNDKEQSVPLLIQLLDKYHYKPPVHNQKLSNQVFDNILKTLDPNSLFFTEETISPLSKSYRDSLVSLNPKLTSEFVKHLSDLYRKRLLYADTLIDKSLATKLNLKEKDSLVLESEEAVKLEKDELALEKRWKKWIKHSMLKSLVFSKLDSSFSKKASLPDSIYAPGSSLAKRTRIIEKRKLNQLLNCSKGIPNFIQSTYLNCIAACYDPHTNYFSENDEEQFESSLSKENYAFGFELGNNLNEEVIISRILPKSPLWYSKALEKGDVLLKIKIPNQEDIDLAFANLDDVDNIFKNLKEHSVKITVKKTNGTIETIEIDKWKFDTQENQTLGFVLQGEKPIGYIWFSAFYTEFDHYRNNGCSIDILREIVKLKESGIKGLILDLRNNPGGSEGEAMEIAGYFNGNGTFALHVDKEGVQNELGKENSVNWYSDPLVILVNNNSASAAELLSANLQDYHRAVIIGSNTFGKATEQLVFPIGRKMGQAFRLAESPSEKYGYAKITMAKIFRVTGKSYQRTGIKPDIVLPDLWEGIVPRESELPFALENDSVKSSVEFEPFPALPIDSLALLSKQRIQNNEHFRKVTQFNNSIKNLIAEKQTVPISYSQYKNESDKRAQLIKDFDTIGQSENKMFTIRNTEFEIKKLQSDSLQMKINNQYKTNIQKDIYVGEAFSVMQDLLRLYKKVEVSENMQ